MIEGDRDNVNSKKFARFLLSLMLFVQWSGGLHHWGLWKVYHKWEIQCEDISLGVSECFSPSGKHTYNINKLVVHTAWQLNEVIYRYSEGPEGGGLRSLGTKIVILGDCGPDRSDITSRLRLQFNKVFLPISVHNLYHLKCTLVGEGIHKLKNKVCQGITKNQEAILGFS